MNSAYLIVIDFLSGWIIVPLIFLSAEGASSFQRVVVNNRSSRIVQIVGGSIGLVTFASLALLASTVYSYGLSELKTNFFGLVDGSVPVSRISMGLGFFICLICFVVGRSGSESID